MNQLGGKGTTSFSSRAVRHPPSTRGQAQLHSLSEPRSHAEHTQNQRALGNGTWLGQDVEGKGYRVAFPLSEILPLAQWKQEAGPSREEAIRNHSPSQHGLPTICYLLHFTIKQNTGRT